MPTDPRLLSVERNLLALFERRAASPQPPRCDLSAPIAQGSGLTGRRALALFEAQLESRVLDLLARELKTENLSFYTIGSSGHEGNAAVADVLRTDDPAFLHYRSGAFFCRRAAMAGGTAGPLDVLLGIVASSDEPIAGGRHKVFGSLPLAIPPQTSTIASHLPKAVGCAVALDRKAFLERRHEERIAVCSFGDASINHASAQAALNTAAWTAYQNVPAPVLFVCEDNGIGISVRTPEGWVAEQLRARTQIHYLFGDGLSLPEAWQAAREAADYVRTRRRPALLHLRTVRLLGHAGSDVEQTYRTPQEIAEDESRDPLLASAALLLDAGVMTATEMAEMYRELRVRLRRLADEALRRPKLTTREEVARPLFRHTPDAARREGSRVAAEETRRQAFGGTLPESEGRPRHLAVQINRVLLDTLIASEDTILFGEDVARKGGVYHVTADLLHKVGLARVFNTLLDETSILGMAIGAGHAGLLPIPEIQYLAYLMNAVDQLRGEAGSLQFFSDGQYSNPMVVRIAGLAYQKGFGGHFHNDNGINAVREIPGILLAVPARGDDAVRMFRTLVGHARADGRVCVFLEPIALYMTKDLYEDGDGLWQTRYPEPGDTIAVGEVGIHGEQGPIDLCIATYANGLWMSLRVARRLAAAGHRVRVIDLRWLQPLPVDALAPHALEAGRLLVVDECRASSGIADAVISKVLEQVGQDKVAAASVVAADCYIPLGAAANLVLVQEPEIESAALSLLARGRSESRAALSLGQREAS